MRVQKDFGQVLIIFCWDLTHLLSLTWDQNPFEDVFIHQMISKTSKAIQCRVDFIFSFSFIGQSAVILQIFFTENRQTGYRIF